ncbi:putative aldouronate transport system substrate-binding protein [Gracilibacillus halotolerans]|uniref:Putative aldouronate transport system substrate-binding protein n=1 Tax=Gracilibacillus halotolerans TaxID=74386 RepID=A0A841RKJ4_9BACI|nr:extracellular solute-binding protein [Gracilibacillus halotolerans]MBB6513019.1 putative aldouronate transport system substrate-binding protein [Gracilibacillus halotolerans]
MRTILVKVKVLSVFVLVCFALIACSQDSSKKSTSEEEELVEELVSEELPETFDEEVTITTVRHVGGDVTFKEGETIENNVHTKWAKDKFNINLDYLWTTSGPNDAFTTKIRLALSSNEEMPDIIALRDAVDQDLIDSKKFMPVGELFDAYASDTWKAAMEEDPSVWYPYMRDGEKMAIPILDYAYNGDTVLFIREDWMKNLNLDAPETIDDVEKIMDAFVTQDPDGNGKDDTYGLTIGFKNALNTWMSGADWIFGAYGTIPNQWNETEEGTLENGSVNPAMKDGLATLKSWMEKGYINKESGLWDETKASELFTSGRAGIIAGPHWLVDWPLPDTKTNIDGAEYRAYPIPTGPNGEAGRRGTAINNGAILINKDADPEVIKAFFVYQNYLFDHYANPEEGGEFEHGFAEGYDYVLQDGEASRDVPGGTIAAEKYSLTFDVARIPSLQLETLNKLANGGEAETPFERKVKLNADVNPEIYEAAKIVIEQKDLAMPNMFTGAPTETQQSRGQSLDKILDEGFNKIIYGELPLDEFDNLVERWKSSGGDELTKEINEWYDSVK